MEIKNLPQMPSATSFSRGSLGEIFLLIQPMILYFDTSAINFICDVIDSDQFSAFSDNIKKRGFEICLSPVNIWEIINCSDELRKERLIYTIQNICSQRLLAEPESLIVDFAARESKFDKLKDLQLKDQFCCSSLADTWTDVKNNWQKTFIVEGNASQSFKLFKSFDKYFHAFLSRGGEINKLNLKELKVSKKSTEGLITALQEITKSIRDSVPVNKHRCYKMTIPILVASIFCVGLTPWPKPIDEMWNRLGIESSTDRFKFVQNNMNFVFESGWFVGIAALMAWQTYHPYSSGNLLDCYHLGYLQYVDELATCDDCFLHFALSNPQANSLKRIKGREFVESLLR